MPRIRSTTSGRQTPRKTTNARRSKRLLSVEQTQGRHLGNYAVIVAISGIFVHLRSISGKFKEGALSQQRV